MKRRTERFRALPLFAILILGAGCAGDSGEEAARSSDDGEPTPGGTAVIAEIADMSLPVTILAPGIFDGALGGDIMNMELIRGAWRDGRLVYLTADESPMAIAKRYEYLAPDSASLRFHMRSDVRWSDGEPVTAEDFVFTYGILGDPALASPRQDYAGLLKSVEAENDSTVVFHFARRHAEMLTHSALPAIPEHVFGDTPVGDIRNHPALRNPANGALPVNGPYMVGPWSPGQEVILVRNPHFQPAGYLDRIVFRIIPDAVTRQVELQTGGVDMVRTITLDQIPTLRQQAPNVRLEREERRFYDFVAYNGRQFEPFNDPEIRRALGLATDRAGIISALQMDEFAEPAGGPYAPIIADLYDPERQAPLPHDPEQARQILADAGWSDGDGDGILDREGQPFSFTLVTNTGNQRRADVSQILQQQWREIGVDAQIQTVEFNTLNENLVAGDFEATLYGWSVGLSPDLTPLFTPGSPFNFTGYDNPRALGLMEQARKQPTPEHAAPFWRDAASQIVADQPYTWLYYMDSVDGVNERIQGARIDTYGAFQNVWEWWIPEQLRGE